MDLSDPHTLELFLEVYGTLPRAGPGGTEHTLRALRAVPGPPPKTVLDLGCGPGAQTLALAGGLPEARILAVDILPAMVEVAHQRIVDAGLADRVTAVVGDMSKPPVAARSQDLIWSEGAIYSMGVANALTRWRPLLASAGAVAFTESIWTQTSQPDELRTWWQSEYPAITDDAGVRAAVRSAGFETIESFELPASAWWNGYYEPMQARIAELKNRYPSDPAASAVVAAAEREIDMHRRYADFYSYGFFIVRPR